MTWRTTLLIISSASLVGLLAGHAFMVEIGLGRRESRNRGADYETLLYVFYFIGLISGTCASYLSIMVNQVIWSIVKLLVTAVFLLMAVAFFLF